VVDDQLQVPGGAETDSSHSKRGDYGTHMFRVSLTTRQRGRIPGGELSPVGRIADGIVMPSSSRLSSSGRDWQLEPDPRLWKLGESRSQVSAVCRLLGRYYSCYSSNAAAANGVLVNQIMTDEWL
jgi:hypothetical protein